MKTLKSALFTFFLVAFLGCSTDSSSSNDNNSEPIDSSKKSVTQVLNDLKNLANDSQKLASYWANLKAENNIPYTNSDSVLFLYKGKATSVSWHGDFNSWSGNSSVNSTGTQISGTDIFYWKSSYPSDSRLDYKVVVDGNWILDPDNSAVQWSGFGPNSELRMPKYVPSPYKNLLANATAGTLSNSKIIQSSPLGYSVSYKVWLPSDFDSKSDSTYPVLYVTDGQEYSDSRLGNLPIVAANLLAEKKIVPLIIVFISPIDPKNSSENRRTNEYVLNDKYSAFLRDELIPNIETDYPTKSKREFRAILGTSLGGLHSAYVMSTIPEVFGRIGIHSPAFWYKDSIFDLVNKTTIEPTLIFMSTGTIGDTEDEADKMKVIFENKKWDFTYIKVNEGHSWGNWSGLMDETLIALFGN